MATALRVYVAAGILGCAIFGGLMVWADNRNIEPLHTVMNYLTLLCLPALLIGGLVIAAGSVTL
jgi:hypothetical protein